MSKSHRGTQGHFFGCFLLSFLPPSIITRQCFYQSKTVISCWPVNVLTCTTRKVRQCLTFKCTTQTLGNTVYINILTFAVHVHVAGGLSWVYTVHKLVLNASNMTHVCTCTCSYVHVHVYKQETFLRWHHVKFSNWVVISSEKVTTRRFGNWIPEIVNLWIPGYPHLHSRKITNVKTSISCFIRVTINVDCNNFPPLK